MDLRVLRGLKMGQVGNGYLNLFAVHVKYGFAAGLRISYRWMAREFLQGLVLHLHKGSELFWRGEGAPSPKRGAVGKYTISYKLLTSTGAGLILNSCMSQTEQEVFVCGTQSVGVCLCVCNREGWKIRELYSLQSWISSQVYGQFYSSIWFN